MTLPTRLARAASAVGEAMAGDGAKQAWAALALALPAALLDRFAILRLIDTAYSPDALWRADLAWVLAAIAGSVLLGRWSRIMALSLAEEVSDSMLAAAAQRLLAAEWRALPAGALRKTLDRIASAARADAGQAAAALPAFATVAVTAAWLGYHEPGALVVVAATAGAGGLLLRRETVLLRASQRVLTDAEAVFDGVADRLLDAAVPSRLTGKQQADICAQALFPAVDDASRAASVFAGASARVAGLLQWIGFLAVIILLTLESSNTQDLQWLPALLLTAATFHPARQVYAACLAFERIGAAAFELDAVTAKYPAAETSVPVAPARWTTIAFSDVRMDESDTPDAYFAAIGPLDLTLHRNEIVALTGPNQYDRAALLHVLCGLLPPDGGAVLLDGRPVPPAMLRGLCGGVLDRDALPAGVSPPADAARADNLLARFDLPPGALRDDGTACLTRTELVRLGLVAAELEDRPVRLYDERAAHLEQRYRPAFVETLREARSRGRTIVVATGDAGVIAAADRVLCLRDGRFVPPMEAAP